MPVEEIEIIASDDFATEDPLNFIEHNNTRIRNDLQMFLFFIQYRGPLDRTAKDSALLEWIDHYRLPFSLFFTHIAETEPEKLIAWWINSKDNNNTNDNDLIGAWEEFQDEWLREKDAVVHG